MPKKRRTKKQEMQFKSAFVSLSDAELGWSGLKGGRTVTVIFRDGQKRKVGTLQVSAARMRWWGAKDKYPFIISSRRVDELFKMWYGHQKCPQCR